MTITRFIRLTDASWHPPRDRAPRILPRGEADRWWHEYARAQARQRVRDTFGTDDPVSGREQAWREWEMLVEEGRIGGGEG